jgi:hypothetical protein
MASEDVEALVAPITIREVLCLVLEADKYPCIGNEDWPIAQRMYAAALEKAKIAVSSPNDPPEFLLWLRELQKPGLTHIEREDILWAMYDYFEPPELGDDQ